MKLFFHGLLSAAVFLATMHTHAQEAFPNRPIRLLVGVAPGSSTDASARVVSERMSRLLGQSVIVDNQPGAGGMVAAKSVVAARPDGHTLLWYFTDSIAIAPLLAKQAPFDAGTDLAYVGNLVRIYGVVLAVPTTSPIRNWDDFVKAARASTKKLNYGTWGVGSSSQLGFEIIGEKLGFQMVHIPYRSGAASYMAAIAGEVDIVMTVLSTPLVRSGKLRPIAVAGARRLPEQPDLPTLVELGIGELAFSPVAYGIAAPKGTPATVLAKIREAAETAVNAPDTLERLLAMGVEPAISDAAHVLSLVRRSNDAYGPIIKRQGLSTE